MPLASGHSPCHTSPQANRLTGTAQDGPGVSHVALNHPLAERATWPTATGRTARPSSHAEQRNDEETADQHAGRGSDRHASRPQTGGQHDKNGQRHRRQKAVAEQPYRLRVPTRLEPRGRDDEQSAPPDALLTRKTTSAAGSGRSSLALALMIFSPRARSAAGASVELTCMVLPSGPVPVAAPDDLQPQRDPTAGPDGTRAGRCEAGATSSRRRQSFTGARRRTLDDTRSRCRRWWWICTIT